MEVIFLYSFNYDRLKDNSRLQYNIDDDYAVLLENVLSMYDFNKFPDTFNSDYFMNYLLTEAWACIGPDRNGNIISLHFSPAGDPDANGIGTNAIVTTENGFAKTIHNWRDQSEYIPCHLNRTYTPDLTLAKTAAFLGESDSSILNILRAARYNKAFLVGDEKAKAQLDQCISAIGDGKPYVILSDNLKNALLGGPSLIDQLELSDPALAERLQYLVKFQDDILRDFYNKYGLSSYGSGKMAQLTVEEATAGENRAEVIPDSRLKILKEWVNKVNAAYNYGASIEYAGPWKDEHKEVSKDEEMADNEDNSGSNSEFNRGGDNDGQSGENMDKNE